MRAAAWKSQVKASSGPQWHMNWRADSPVLSCIPHSMSRAMCEGGAATKENGCL